MEMIAASRSLLAMDAVGLCPDGEKRIVTETASFVMSAFGKRIL